MGCGIGERERVLGWRLHVVAPDDRDDGDIAEPVGTVEQFAVPRRRDMARAERQFVDSWLRSCVERESAAWYSSAERA